jgi:hypothetical protein
MIGGIRIPDPGNTGNKTHTDAAILYENNPAENNIILNLLTK